MCLMVGQESFWNLVRLLVARLALHYCSLVVYFTMAGLLPFVQRDVDVVVARGQSIGTMKVTASHVKFLTFEVTFSLVLPN